MMNDKEKAILADFNEVKDSLMSWGKFIDVSLMTILKPLIEFNSLKMPPSFRMKDDKSYLSKALYRGKSYQNPIIDIEDKIGTRVVLLKSEDIKVAAEIIMNSTLWEAKVTKNLALLIHENPKEFDYQSVHIVVSPNKNTTEYKSETIPLLTCEIQIRTLLQHAFAEISHDSTYKGPYKNDREIIRHLSKSMALMEATDDYFCKIFEMMTDEKRKYKNYLSELKTMYLKFVPGFDSHNIDVQSADLIFELLSEIDIPVDSISLYVNKNETALENVIKPKNGFLFTQPIILLVLYFLNSHRTILKNKWPLSQDSLKGIYTAMGISFDTGY